MLKGIKFPIADFQITPDVAIVDPELTYTMPAKLCAHTGMDALTHAIESYVSTAASMYTEANSLHAIREIVEWLPESYKGDKEARKHMHDAQCIAGIAFSSGLLGIVHSMAHKTGACLHRRSHHPWLRQRYVPRQGHPVQLQGPRGQD